MNRKGHIATALLPFIALILVGNALFVMINFKDHNDIDRAKLHSLSGEFVATHDSTIQNVNYLIFYALNSSNDSVQFDKSFNDALHEIAGQERIRGQNTNIYAKLALGEYSLEFKDSKYTMIVSDIFEDYSIGDNEVKYDYSIKIVFDKNHVISIEEIY